MRLAIGWCVGVALVVVAFVGGCSWTVPDWCAKGQTALKQEVSPRVEPPLKAECVKRAQACKAKGIAQAQCTPVHTCTDWVARYVLATKTAHRGLSLLNGLWHDLVKAKVVK